MKLVSNLTRRSFGGLLCLLLALFFCLPAHASYVLLNGTHYPLRYGSVEGSTDDVTPSPPRWGVSYCCFKKGAVITLQLVKEPGDTINSWKVKWAKLVRKGTGEVIWDIPEDANRPLLSISQSYALKPLPDYIEYAELQGEIIATTDVIEPPNSSGSGTDSLESFAPPILLSDVFIVLDTPKAPMSPAWVSVLKHACVWARYKATNDDAAEALTKKLWDIGAYNGGGIAYTSPQLIIPPQQPDDPEKYQKFYLKSFLAGKWNGINNIGPFPSGQCDDFADFLQCLMTSVGGHPLKIRRTLASSNYNSGLVFWTRPIIAAHQSDPMLRNRGSIPWVYHQFPVLESDAFVWDGCLVFSPTVTAKDYVIKVKLDTGTENYETGLIDFSKTRNNGNPTYNWLLSPNNSGIVPEVTTETGPKPRAR